MSQTPNTRYDKRREGVLGAVSAGCFLILIGLIFAITPNLFSSVVNFFSDFGIVPVPRTEISLPAPKTPSMHTVVYQAVFLFSLIWGILEIVFLVLRIIIRSPLSKKAETASNIVFWLGTSYFINLMLSGTINHTAWFVFWTEIVMLAGVTLIVRAIILAFKR